MKPTVFVALLAALGLLQAGCVEIHDLVGTGVWFPSLAEDDGADDFAIGDGAGLSSQASGDASGGDDAGDSGETDGSDGPSNDAANDADSAADTGDQGADSSETPETDQDLESSSQADDDSSSVPPIPDDAIESFTDSGLQLFDVVVGSGDMPTSTSSVRVDYVGYLEDGTIFDSNEDIVFDLGFVIDGFAEGISTMRIGGERRIVIPPELGYGEGGNPGAGIGGEDTIIFDVTLHGIEEL